MSKWGSLTLSSKRVWAETTGFFHLLWMKRVKGENEIGVGVALYLKLDNNGFMLLSLTRRKMRVSKRRIPFLL